MPHTEFKLPRYRLQQIQRLDDAIPSEAHPVIKYEDAVLTRSRTPDQLRADRAAFAAFAIWRPIA